MSEQAQLFADLPDDGPADIAVVMVAYWTGDVLFSAIDAVLAEPATRQVLLVDNGNDTPTRLRLARMKAEEPRFVVIEGQGNIGFAAGCNLGAAHADSPYLAFINPDCVVSRGSLARLRDTLKTDPDVWVVTPRLVGPDGAPERGTPRAILTPWVALVELLHLWRLAPRHPTFQRLNLFATDAYWEGGRVPAISGAFMLMPAARFRQAGGFDERYFLHVEDLDFCLTVARLKGVILYAPGIVVTHHRSSSRVSRLRLEWHKARGARLYMRKNFDGIYPRWALRLIGLAIGLRFVGVLSTLLFRR
ncbi:MAG: glycosyltransferase family 2 protein [Proteobacteria bacterium]|nr:glycosyltransferase family 2 protein [Pseudomonadota bacterium]